MITELEQMVKSKKNDAGLTLEGEDLLIGGTTAYDTDPALANWLAIANYWAGMDDFATRSANLQSGTGVPLGTFLPAVTLQLGANAPRDVRLADLNGDGFLDIITADYGSNGGPAARVTTRRPRRSRRHWGPRRTRNCR
jgi:hypothetical protein